LLLTIEKLIYGGDGLARLPADEHGRGKAVFVPFVLAGEKIDASLTEQKPGFARARAEKILDPSPHRVDPACPYFSRCGGCHYQHASYDHQLAIKKEILRETLRRTAKLDLPFEIQVYPSPPWNYRNRSRLQVRTTPDFAVGYFKLASRELLPVEECPISSPLINRGIATLWQIGRAGKVPPGVHEIEFFANAEADGDVNKNDSQLLIDLSCTADARRAAVRAFAEDLRAALPEVAGVVAFRESKPGVTPETWITTGESFLTYHTQRADYRVSAGSFFQTNRYLTDELVKIVTQGQSGALALDLYAGVGLFSTALACDFRHIVSVESSQLSSDDLSYNCPANVESLQATTEQYLSRTENSGRIGKGAVLPQVPHQPDLAVPDLAVIDPPRSGLGDSVARLLANLGASRVIYVSCDPATLARDLVHLLGGGYRVEQVHLVDLFPQTYHVESVIHLAR
jgi:23S rRNA (uracil1939-C5)-methyltransferase